MINQLLWHKASAFELDDNLSEYGFSTRLADENNWTVNFTREAIAEYKKFMYLAAISDRMISPSEIVDTVWHQHLIFTKSYTELCELLGKRIEHVPSTHNRAEAEKFRLAKQITKELYEREFGTMPDTYWNHSSIYEPLHLTKNKYKLRGYIIAGILSFLILLLPVAHVLRPLYVQIKGPQFPVGYLFLFGLSVVFLYAYNYKKFNTYLNEVSRSAFIFNLSAYELNYLGTEKLGEVVTATTNNLIKKKLLKVTANYTLSLDEASSDKITVPYEYWTIQYMQMMQHCSYGDLLRHLSGTPVYRNIKHSMDQFRKYFIKSTLFASIFKVNFIVLGILLLLGTARILTGIMNHKPILFICLLICVALGATVLYLFYITHMFTKNIIPTFYREKWIHELDKEDDWHYFMIGNAALAAAFLPVVHTYERANAGDGGNSGGSCGGGCGSSCGGGCGGCGS